MAARESLKVLQICHDYEGPFRAVCRQYADGFRDHHVTTVYLRGEERADVAVETGGDHVRFFDEKPLRGIKLGPLLHVAALLRGERFDVVIAHRYKPIYIAGVLSYFFPIRILLGVVHEHGVFERATRSMLLTRWCRKIHILAVSDAVRQDVLRTARGIEVGRVHRLPHAVDTSRRSHLLDRDKARSLLGLSEGDFCFANVGRLVAKKDHQVLIEAFARADLPGSRLIIAGWGEREDFLKRHAARQGLGDRVIFTGRLIDAWQYFRAFDVFVLASGMKEAFGMVLLEAMTAGIPVVSSNAPGPAEVVGDAGILFETGDADDLAGKMTAVMQMNKTRLRELGEKGRRRADEMFSLDSFRERLWALPPLRDIDNKEAG